MKEVAFSEYLTKVIKTRRLFSPRCGVCKVKCKMWIVFQVLNVCIITNVAYEALSFDGGPRKHPSSVSVRVLRVYQLRPFRVFCQ